MCSGTAALLGTNMAASFAAAARSPNCGCPAVPLAGAILGMRTGRCLRRRSSSSDAVGSRVCYADLFLRCLLSATLIADCAETIQIGGIDTPIARTP